MVGFSLPLTFPLLTVLLYHRIEQKSIRNVAQSFGEKVVQNDGRQFVGKKCHLWNILEKRRSDDRRCAGRKEKDLCRHRGLSPGLNILAALPIAIWLIGLMFCKALGNDPKPTSPRGRAYHTTPRFVMYEGRICAPYLTHARRK